MNERREDGLMLRAGQLAKGVAPGRDLWPGIADAIETPARRPWQMSWVAQAAAVLLLVGASSAVTYVVVDGGRGLVRSDTTNVIGRPVSYGGEVLGADVDYQKARGELEKQLQDELRHLAPDTRADVERNLTIIRGAIAEISVALDAEPDNALLQQLLLKSYQEELTLMQDVGGLTQRAMARKDI